MLHSIGTPQPSAQVLVNNYNRAGLAACVHAFIDANNGDTYQTLPWHIRGWHCASGKNGSANNTHLGIEMCEPKGIKYTGGSTFIVTDEATARRQAQTVYKAAVELFAYLCLKYNLNPLQDGVIISHKEGYERGIASNHGDPEHLWKGLGLPYTMNTFRTDVASMLKKEDEEEMTQEQFNQMMDNYLADRAKQMPSIWMLNTLDWAKKEGIMKGDNYGNLMPKSFITREECAALIERVYNKLK